MPPGVTTLVPRVVSVRQRTRPLDRSSAHISVAAPTITRSPHRYVARRSMPGTMARHRAAYRSLDAARLDEGDATMGGDDGVRRASSSAAANARYGSGVGLTLESDWLA